MLASTQPLAFAYPCNAIHFSNMETQKRLFLDEGEVVLPEAKKRRKEPQGISTSNEQHLMVNAVMDEDLPLNEGDEIIECDKDVSMCRDMVHCPKIQVNVPLELYTALPTLDHRLSSSSSLAIVPYLGRLPDTSPCEDEEEFKNSEDEQGDTMVTD